LRIGLGTWVAIEARLDPLRAAGPLDEPHVPLTSASEHSAIEAAYAAIRDIDIRMHPHREGSEIARINSAEPGTPIELQPDTWRLLQLARRLYDITDGIFDPCLPTRPGRLGDIEIQPNTPALICHVPVELDLGGIAKGHAIDRAVEKLQESGCASGLVNAGGDLRVFGDRSETIFLRRRVSEPTFNPLSLKNAALAVSDLDADNRPSEHQGYYVRGRNSSLAIPHYAAVIASTAATADALTKCVLLCPTDLGMRVLQKLEGRIVKP
jgi:thiamine biosynthesis lipoprotein